MSDIRFNGWLHRSGSGGVYQDSSGRVGIGTSTQNHSLVLYQADSGTHDCISMRNSTTVNNGFTLGVSSTEDAFIWNGSNTNMTFATNNSERLRIAADGKLLVGKNSAYGSAIAQVHNTSQYVLDLNLWSADANAGVLAFYKSRNATPGGATIVQDDDGIASLRFLGNDGANSREAGYIKAFVDGTPGTDDMPGRIVFGTTADGAAGSTERLRITSAGNVAIGNASPQQLLHVWPDTANTTSAYVRVSSGDRGSGTGIDLGSDADGDGRLNVVSNGNLKLYSNNTERLRIRSDGKISCGTAINNTNTYELSLTGADGTGGFYAHGRNHYLSNRSNAYASLTLKKSNADSDGVDYLQIRDSGNNYLSGISGAGNWKPAAGKGIDFSSTSDAGTVDSELLDDYENGSWTPTCSYSVTLSTAFGYYTRIGHRVICDMFITVNNDQSNQTFEINNLPFTSGNGYDLSVPAVRMSSWDLPTGTLWVSGHTGAAKMSFHCNKDNANYVVLPADSGGGMIVSFTYEVA